MWGQGQYHGQRSSGNLFPECNFYILQSPSKNVHHNKKYVQYKIQFHIHKVTHQAAAAKVKLNIYLQSIILQPPPPHSNYHIIWHCCCFCCFTSHVNSYGHCGTVNSLNHTFSWAGLNKRLTSNLCTYFRL